MKLVNIQSGCEYDIVKLSFTQRSKRRFTGISGLIGISGFIFIGLMNVDGNPYVIEYNVRMGDPETESVLPRIENDLVDLFVAVAEGRLNEKKIITDPRHAATVMLVSDGYPEAYDKGKEIKGLEEITDSYVFHAGTKISGKENKLITNGGRVLAITSLAYRMEDATFASLKNAALVRYSNKYYRKDIGEDLLKFSNK